MWQQIFKIRQNIFLGVVLRKSLWVFPDFWAFQRASPGFASLPSETDLRPSHPERVTHPAGKKKGQLDAGLF